MECKRRGPRVRAGRHGSALPGTGDPDRLRGVLPGVWRGCYACFGPKQQANVPACMLVGRKEQPAPAVDRLFAGFNAWAPIPAADRACRAMAAHDARRTAH